MEKRSEVVDMMEDFINAWAKFSIEHPEITLGDWLKAFSIMTGLAMHMGDMPAQHIDDALGEMRDMTVGVFKNADKHVSKATLQ